MCISVRVRAFTCCWDLLCVFWGPDRKDVSVSDCKTKPEQEEASEGSGVLPHMLTFDPSDLLDIDASSRASSILINAQTNSLAQLDIFSSVCLSAA